MAETTRYTVLGLVRRRPTYGYALVSQLDAWPLSDLLVPPSRAIFKALDNLKHAELIEPLPEREHEPGGRQRRWVQVTPSGEREYGEWLRRQPATFAELCLRIGTARPEDLPALIEIVIAAEHQCLAQYRELRSPEAAAVIAKGARWESVTAAILADVEYAEVANRAAVLRDLREMLEDLRDGSPAGS